MLESVCVTFAGIFLHLFCFGVIKLVRMGNISSIPKERSLGCILDMLRSEKQWHLNGSQLNNLAVEALYKGEEHSDDNEHARRGGGKWRRGPPLDLRSPILISPIGAPEIEMATHSSILACRISWTEEPGRLQSMGAQRLGHNWVTNTYTSRPHTANCTPQHSALPW